MQIAKHTTIAVKAALATDTGAFTAIAAAYSVDRVNDRIEPGAFKDTIKRWKASGKLIPLHWDHSGDPKDIIGVVDPATMRETDDGLYVEGSLDLTGSDTAKEAWRLMKSGAMSLSFGYLVIDSVDVGDGVTALKAVDLFEISVTPAPANADTRFLSLKAIGEMSREEILAELDQLGGRVQELRKAVEGQEPEPQVEETPPVGKGAEAETPKASDPDDVKTERAWLDAVAPQTAKE